MPRKLNWVLSASLAVGGVAFIGQSTVRAADQNDQSNTSAQQPRNDQNVGDKSAERGTGTVQERTTGATPLALPSGASQSNEMANAASLSAPIVGATNQAMSKDGLDNMVGYFVDQDRDRLKDIDKLDAKELNGRIDALNKTFHDKYNVKFDLDDRDFSANQAVKGEIQDPNQFVQNWPVPLINSSQQASANTGANAQQASAQQVDEDTRKNGNIEKGRNVAIVRLPAEERLPAMDVSLIGEAGGWKIDVPNDRSAQQIHDDVLKQLTMLGEHSDQWPSDPLQAKRLFARHVLAAIYGVDIQQDQQNHSQQQNQQQQGQ